MSATHLDGLAIGSLISSAASTVNGTAAHFGMVVDVGVTEHGEAFVEYLEELSDRECRVNVWWGGAAKPKAPHVARLARMALAEVASVEEPVPSRMEGWAQKALLGAALLPSGASQGHDLVVAAGTLLMESKEHYPKRKGDALEAELRAALADAEEKAS